MKVKAIVRACGKGLVSAVVLSAACASTPAARFDAEASGAGLQTGEVGGAGFAHRTYATPRSGTGEVLFVYFAGDGAPFIDRRTVSRDPTPRRPLTLELMLRGPEPAVLLGRPCYHGFAESCSPALWTIGRYSEPVVASMTAATRRLIDEGGFASAVLVGYSGGGTLALLVAERLDRVRAVVTLAANLDTRAWTTLHGYSPLTTSIDPVTVAGTRDDLGHLHLSGAEDANVPPALHRRLEASLPAGALRELPGFDHRCCWVRAWPGLMADIAFHEPPPR